jgi:transcriptional antiterminator NusG
MKYDNWYGVQTTAGREKRAMNDLVARRSMVGDTYITDIEVPEGTELSITEDGKQKIKRKKLLPGYMLIRVLDEKVEDEDGTSRFMFPTTSHDLILSTANVIGFIGADKKKPVRMSKSEVRRLFDQVDTSHLEVKTNVLSDYLVGDSVEIVAGPFAGTMIIIDQIQSNKITTTIDICGRMTKLELNSNQVYRKS